MPLRQLFSPSNEAVGSEVVIDIIAVHGLNPHSKNAENHAWNTWRKPSKDNGRLWLKDDLPLVTPNARIFLYEYDSSVVYGHDRGTFIDKANELLEALRIKRGPDKERPLIFLAHSLGGLLVEQALVNAHNNPKYNHIKEATSGIAFFATPHNGGRKSLVSIGGLAAQIALGLGFQKGDNLIETLESGSIFTDLLHEHWRHQLLQYDIISFWGSYDKIVTKNSSQFGLPGDCENIVKLDADHGDVCRFDRSQHDEDNLELVQGNIRDIYENAAKLGKEVERKRVLEKVSEQRTKLLQSLYRPKDQSKLQTNYESHKARNLNPVPGTCSWILHQPKYHTWRKESSSSLLWVAADAGCGKSVLAKFLIDELIYSKSEQDIDRNVCYFFFKDDNDAQSSALYALRALIHQLLIAKSSLPPEIGEAYNNKGDALLDQLDSLWNIFTSTATETGEPNTLCILDGLDECEIVSRRLLINKVVQYFGAKSPEKGPYLKVIITSRPDNAIKNAIGKLPAIWLRRDMTQAKTAREFRLEIEAEDTEHDLRLVIDHDLNQLKEQELISDQMKNLLHERLLERADQTFLWISLIMTLIRDATEYGASENELLAILNDRSINSLYQKIVEKCLIKPGAEQKFKSVLQIIVAAKRPMTVWEIDTALAIRSSDKILQDLRPNLHTHPDNYITEICGHFVKCRENTVYFVHQTAREFIINQEIENQLTTGQIYGPLYQCIKLPAAHTFLGGICCLYLFFNDFEDIPSEFAENEWADTEIQTNFCGQRPLFQYAACSWQHHIRQSDDSLNSDLSNLAWRLCDTRTTRFWTWFYVAGHRWARTMANEATAADYLALRGRLKDHDIEDISLSPLSWADREKKYALIRLLQSLRLSKGGHNTSLTVSGAATKFRHANRERRGVVTDYDTKWGYPTMPAVPATLPESHKESFDYKKHQGALSVAKVQHNKARQMVEHGQLEEATNVYSRALKRFSRILGNKHKYTLICIGNLARAFGDMGNYEDAATLHRIELRGFLDTLDPQHPLAIGSLNNLAVALGSQGDYDRAEVCHLLATALFLASQGPEAPDTISSFENLQVIMDVQNKPWPIVIKLALSRSEAISGLRIDHSDADERIKRIIMEIPDRTKRLVLGHWLPFSFLCK